MATNIQPGPGGRDAPTEGRSPPKTISVHDVVRHIHHELRPSERMLRVPYDLFKPDGPVTLRDGLITYLEGGESKTGSTAESSLADAHPGERVLLRLQDGVSQSDEWWLCQIERPEPFV